MNKFTHFIWFISLWFCVGATAGPKPGDMVIVKGFGQAEVKSVFKDGTATVSIPGSSNSYSIKPSQFTAVVKKKDGVQAGSYVIVKGSPKVVTAVGADGSVVYFEYDREEVVPKNKYIPTSESKGRLKAGKPVITSEGIYYIEAVGKDGSAVVSHPDARHKAVFRKGKFSPTVASKNGLSAGSEVVVKGRPQTVLAIAANGNIAYQTRDSWIENVASSRQYSPPAPLCSTPLRKVASR